MGTLYVVATPIGNLADLSPRALEVLRSCDLILAEDTRYSKRLLQHFDIHVPLISYHKFNERSRAEQVLQRLASEAISVALISDAGTPCISDPGTEIVRRARELGIPVYGVSGPSAVATAISVSGLPAREFTFLGFLPRSAGELKEAFQSIRERRLSTFVVYESPRRIHHLARALLAEFPQAQVCFCCELTKKHERAYWGRIAEVVRQLEADPEAGYGEYTVVVHVEHDPPAPTPSEGQGLSLEARLVQTMVERECSLKEAVAIVAGEVGVPRREVYQASLRLRSLLAGKEDEA